MNSIHASHGMPNKNTQYGFNNLLSLLTISPHTLNQRNLNSNKTTTRSYRNHSGKYQATYGLACNPRCQPLQPNINTQHTNHNEGICLFLNPANKPLTQYEFHPHIVSIKTMATSLKRKVLTLYTVSPLS